MGRLFAILNYKDFNIPQVIEKELKTEIPKAVKFLVGLFHKAVLLITFIQLHKAIMFYYFRNIALISYELNDVEGTQKAGSKDSRLKLIEFILILEKDKEQ